jgi:hypothetical protein
MRKAAPKKQETLLDKVTHEERTEESEIAIEDMPLETLSDYMRYNARARAANKKLRVCRYPAKPCPVELHPKQRIIFGRNDQPSNPLPVHKSDDMIHFEQKLVPGQTYDLPHYIIEYLGGKGTPVYERYTKSDGSEDTREVSKSPRFAIRTVYNAG